jgi:hypothetical protein
MSNLPFSDSLNTDALSRLFDRTTNSYKYLFFLALLDILQQRNNDAPIPLEDVAAEMLARAWRSHREYGLTFGTQDQMIKHLNVLAGAIANPSRRDIGAAEIKGLMRGQLEDSAIELMRYVPYRLIRPFFEDEVKGLKDTQVNLRIAELADEEFSTLKPIYQFDAEHQSLVMHPEWAMYFQEHRTQVQRWAFNEWVEYMDRCNPTVTDVESKLPLTLYGLVLVFGGSLQQHWLQIVNLFDSRMVG